MQLYVDLTLVTFLLIIIFTWVVCVITFSFIQSFLWGLRRSAAIAKEFRVHIKMGNTDVVGAVVSLRGTVLFPSEPTYLSVLESAETCCGAHPLFYSVVSGSELPASEND